MTWDFAEANPFNPGHRYLGESRFKEVVWNIDDLSFSPPRVVDESGSATALTWPDGFFDAVITDPPYYDNVPYADIADYFFVWLKRTVGHLSLSISRRS